MALLHNLISSTTAPTITAGVIWLDTSAIPNVPKVYNGSAWETVAAASIAANDGLTTDGLGTVLLGQTIGQSGNPAKLLQDREVPLNGFSMQFTGSVGDVIIASDGSYVLVNNGFFTKVGINTQSPAAGIDVVFNALGATVTDVDGIALSNNTVATNSIQAQISPLVRFRASSYNTIDSTAYTADWRIYNKTFVSSVSTGVANSILSFEYQNNSGGYGQVMYLNNNQLVVAAQLVANNAEVSGLLSLDNNVALTSTGAGGLYIYEGTTATNVRISNTNDSMGNQEFVDIGWQNTANVFTLAPGASGTGVIRNMNFVGNVGFNQTSPGSAIDVGTVYNISTAGSVSAINLAPTLNVTAGFGQLTGLALKPTINITGGSGVVVGIDYQPILSGTPPLVHYAFRNGTGNNLFNSTSGFTQIGSGSTGGTASLQVGGNMMVFGNSGFGQQLAPVVPIDIVSSVTGSATTQTISIATTWNTTGVVNLINANITNTASGVGSKLINLSISGGSVFGVTTAGLMNVNSAAFGASIQTGSKTIDTTAIFWIYSGSSAGTFTVPAISGNTGKFYILKNRGTGTLTVQASGSDNFFTTSSVTSFTMATGDTHILIIDGGFISVL